MLLAEILEEIKTENARSRAKYGPWRDYGNGEQASAIQSEYAEWYSAYTSGDIDGPHGEIRELTQLANLCCRRIQHLTGEPDA